MMRKLSKTISVMVVLAILLSMGGMPSYSAEPPETAPGVVVFPVNKARILAGATFDLKVELNNISGNPSQFDVKVKGNTADTFFNKAAETGATTQNGQYKMWTGVTFKDAGLYTVSVNAGGDGWTLAKEIQYEVVKAQAGKTRNVILIIGL